VFGIGCEKPPWTRRGSREVPKGTGLIGSVQRCYRVGAGELRSSRGKCRSQGERKVGPSLVICPGEEQTKGGQNEADMAFSSCDKVSINIRGREARSNKPGKVLEKNRGEEGGT